MTRTLRLTTQAAIIAWAFACTGYGLAAEPTKGECISASESAQDLRHAGKLRESRVQVAVCVGASCPGPIREDCGRLLAELDKALPTVVFDVKDSSGNDVSSVNVTLDGHPIAEKLSGAIPIDPGEHRFVFDADGSLHAEKTLVLHEGDRNRRERIVLGPPRTPEGSEQVSKPAKHEGLAEEPSKPGSSRTLAFAVGGVGIAGLAAGGIFGLVASSKWSSSQNECQSTPNCKDHASAVSDHDAAMSAATISTIAAVAGGVALGAGAVLFFTSSHDSRATTSTGLRVAPAVGPGAAGLLARGEF